MGFEQFEIVAVVAVLIIVAASYFSTRLGLATPIILVIVGLGVSLIPGMPEVHPAPELILTVVLPPLLYSAAVNMPVMDFRRDLSTIGALSVVLVLVSAFVVGTLLWAIFPDLSYAAAVAVGAVVSPPDAVAATSIGKRLGLPPRLLTILEGEGLVNDATALVLLRTAVAATAGAFSFWHAAGDFFYAVAVAIVVGTVVGFVAVRIRSKIDQPVLTTAISFVVPFIAFLPAELAHASGVLAVVAAGLVTGATGVRRLSVADRNAERTNWLTAQLLLENGVFLLMGLQLMTLIDDVSHDGLSVWSAVWIGLAVTVLLGVIRTVFVVPVVFTARRRRSDYAERARRFSEVLDHVSTDERLRSNPRRERLERWLQRRHADARFYAGNGLGWRGGAVLAWSGMRGVVTLAAAQSLPTDFPYRTQLVLVAFVVALVTLVGQGGTLPLLIRVLGIRGTDEERARRELSLLLSEVNEAAVGQVVDNPDLRRRDGRPFDPAVLERARQMHDRMTSPRSGGQQQDSAKAQLPELLQLILDAQQDALNEARSTGSYDSSTIKRAQKQLDQGYVRITGA
ncbi:sodium:proton antiporter [Brachybacterium fresconis]|uniref:CPA1 family monovalent cation:H+ antiporter n=1 Tax=Brachybacterium fresconis TaxID=173363 RepID=A0ABS4YFW8_9MICO|nr:CPA1 family monovalent cation:H+ antiporter [Brachybacterium fresconis]